MLNFTNESSSGTWDRGAAGRDGAKTKGKKRTGGDSRKAIEEKACHVKVSPDCEQNL